MKKAIMKLSGLLLLMVCAVPWGAMSAPPSQDALLETMQLELKRATTLLAKSNPVPHYLSYAGPDASAPAIVATDGAIANPTAVHRRQADVMMRVGAAALDNTHGASRPSGIASGSLALNDDKDAMARVLWQLTDREYEQASSAF